MRQYFATQSIITTAWMHHKCTKFHCSQSKSCWDMWGCISCRHHSNAADARYFFSLCLWNTGQTWKDEWLNKSLKNEPYLVRANELDSQSLTSFLPRCLWCSSFSFLSSSYSRTRFFVALTLPSPRLFFFFLHHSHFRSLHPPSLIVSPLVSTVGILS